jgi:EpsD family peptidyl-prolyl cis-trans isomerase
LRTGSYVMVALLGAALTMSGCDRVKSLVGGKPKGQVVATVNGKEITALELRTELGGFGSRDPAIMKAAQQQALERIILRRLLADEARKAKLDKSPDYVIQVQRGEDTLLTQLYTRRLAAALPKPSKQDADTYVSANPDKFAGRKVLYVDQVIAAPNKIAPDSLRPLKTLDQVKALLDAEGVQYQQTSVVLDTLSADPRLVRAVNTLPAGEIFVIPQSGSLLFNQISASRSVPFTGEMASAYAMNLLRGERAQEAVGKKIEAMRKAADNSIVYNPAYKPAAPKPASKPPAAAAAGAPVPASTASPSAGAPAIK